MVPWRYYAYVLVTVWAVVGAIYLAAGLAGEWLGPEVIVPVLAVVTIVSAVATNRQMR